MEQSAFVRSVYQEVYSIFADGFQAPDLIALTGVIMRILQAKPHLKGKGSAKKEAAIAVFSLFLHESGLFGEEESIQASRFIVSSLPTLIDTIKELSKDFKKRVCCGFF